MNYPADPRLMEAKTIPIAELVDRLGIAGLRPMAGELIGPCPLCGGRDRFGINLRSNQFLCRKCDLRGGDQVALAGQVLGLEFKDTLAWLCGDAPAQIDPAEMERRAKKAAEAQRRQDDYAEKARRRARLDAKNIWNRATRNPAALAGIAGYLERRGITPAMLPVPPAALRWLPDHACVKKIGGELVTLHRGPAMIALIQAADNRGAAVHQTWVDLGRAGGKAVITHEGEAQPAKMVRGSKKGGAIRLSTPKGATVLVMAEGIETTLSAMVAQPIPDAAYWAGVDLGNMAGIMQRVKGVKYSAIPDMSDRDAFLPPAWVRRLVYIMDGDSEPAMTRAKLECGLRRAMAARPGLKGQIVQAGAGVDLNDVLKGPAA